MAIGSDTQIQNLVGLAASGDPSARELLLLHAKDRLTRLTRKMLRGYPKLRGWEQTDDVCQNAMLRLHRALEDVPIESASHFFNLPATQIRRELCDLARHHVGPQGGATGLKAAPPTTTPITIRRSKLDVGWRSFPKNQRIWNPGPSFTNKLKICPSKNVKSST